MSKYIHLREGKLVKDSQKYCWMSEGTVDTVELHSMQEMADLLCRLKENQAIGLSNSDWRDLVGTPERVVSERKRKSGAEGITRSLENFKFEQGRAACVLFDRDSSDGVSMTRERALTILGEMIPGFADLAVLVRDSSSSHIYLDDGKLLSGEGNHHTYLVAKNAVDIQRFAQALEGRLWLNGYGRPFISRSGIFQARTVFDTAVFSPERLVFEADPKLEKGLVQKRAAPWYREGKQLDTAAIDDLTATETQEVARLQAECRRKVDNEIARARAAYTAQEIKKQVDRGVGTDQAEKIVADRISGRLNDEDQLYFDHLNREAVTVAHVRKQPKDFIDKPLADPLEPDYTGVPGSIVKGKAMLLQRTDGTLFIKSFAHGDCRYDFPPGESFEAVQDTPEQHVDRTDSGNVAVMAQLTNGDLRYVPETKIWLGWIGSRWEPDRFATNAHAQALRVGQQYLDQAEEMRRTITPDMGTADRKRITQVADSIKKWGEHCRNKKGLDNMLGLAKVDSRFALSTEKLDLDTWLFGVDNGVVDLRTGELRKASRDEYVTRRSPVTFRSDAKAPRWVQFIDEITSKPAAGGANLRRPALANYLQRALGYSMTGETREHKMFIAIGDGSNGKSVLLDLLKEIMGDYCESIPPEALMATRYDSDAERATPIARRLAGARVATSSESKEGQKLDVALVKRHTGGGHLTARGLHEQAFTFIITHKLWLMTNHKPALDNVDAAMRGRLHMIPFDMRWNRPSNPERNPAIPDGDKTLPDKLKTEVEGILAWLVAGAVAYQRDGLDPPPEVAGMTNTYFSDQDPFGQWLATCTPCSVKDGQTAGELHIEYRQFCDQEGFDDFYVGSQKSFATKLAQHGIDGMKFSNGKRYGLRSSIEDVESLV